MPGAGTGWPVAAVLNMTAVGPSSPTFLSVYPGPTQPVVSDLDPARAEVEAKLAVATVDTNGDVTVFTHTGTTNLVVDVTGWNQPAT